ncbi:MAG TPA: hypothetical protein VF773_19495 [Verrucomicrobiae bacterium]
MATISAPAPFNVIAAVLLSIGLFSLRGDENVYLLDVPDYSWHAGCFGTASGNLMGFWDRNGLTNMYAGPTGGGVAPLNSQGANASIRSLWASQAGMDGRPATVAGHMDDYWVSALSFESTAPDPYVTAGRAEHAPDSLGDFMGQSQRKYSNLDGECNGNIDGFAFNFWDKTGNRRTNFKPSSGIRDIQSGLREFARWRGYDAIVASQLVNVNPEAPSGTGFTFEDIKAEINAGFPVILILQKHSNFSRDLPGLARANPNAHAVLVHGYVEYDSGAQAVWFKTSWGQGDELGLWEDSDDFIFGLGLPMRGAITVHLQPRITNFERAGAQVRLKWEGPSARLWDDLSKTSRPVHHYVVERADSLDGEFIPVSPASGELEALVNPGVSPQQFFRVKLVAAN